MANKQAEIAMIGDRDSVLLAKAAGLAVFDETDAEKASKLIHRLARRLQGDFPYGTRLCRMRRGGFQIPV